MWNLVTCSSKSNNKLTWMLDRLQRKKKKEGVACNIIQKKSGGGHSCMQRRACLHLYKSGFNLVDGLGVQIRPQTFVFRFFSTNSTVATSYILSLGFSLLSDVETGLFLITESGLCSPAVKPYVVRATTERAGSTLESSRGANSKLRT